MISNLVVAVGAIMSCIAQSLAAVVVGFVVTAVGLGALMYWFCLSLCASSQPLSDARGHDLPDYRRYRRRRHGRAGAGLHRRVGPAGAERGTRLCERRGSLHG